jgi:8-oxo-dGTP pyrophosphatase MutT (NUDIX family)
VDLLPFAEYAASLNRKRVAAGVLFRDEHDRVLLVETTYKRFWEIPGGSVDADEAPWRTAVREVREEVGIDQPPGRLLVIDYMATEEPMPEGLAFVFDGGMITDEEVANIEISDPEIRSIGLYAQEDVRRLVKPVLARRIEAALDAIRVGDLALCESGNRVTAERHFR